VTVRLAGVDEDSVSSQPPPERHSIGDPGSELAPAPVLASSPPERHGSEVASPTLPLPPPRDQESLGRFVEAVASTPNEGRAEIRDAIGGLTDRSQVAELLHEALMRLPCTDSSRHNMLLSIIGELAEPTSVEVLQRFVWMSDDELYGDDPPTPSPAGCDFTPLGMLQARAAEMLAWILRTDREDLLMSVIADHPIQAVRVAAIDAYLFHRDDDTDVASGLRDRVRAEDTWAVGLVRRFRGMDTDDFDRLVSEHESQHGSHPEKPRRSSGADNVY
jgi:hypothetical protein